MKKKIKVDPMEIVKEEREKKGKLEDWMQVEEERGNKKQLEEEEGEEEKKEEEEEDELVEEIDIILNSSLAKDLCLFQFPLRPNHRGGIFDQEHHSQIKNLRMKPIHFKLCAELELNRFTNQFDVNYEATRRMDPSIPFRINLNAAKVPLQTNYALGIYNEGKLHLTSIENAVQFRPTFQHIDEIHRETKKGDEEKEELDSVAPVSGEMIPVQLQYKKKETARAAAARKKLQLKKAEEEEPWIDLTYVKQIESSQIREKLYEASDKTISVDMKGNQYLDLLNPFPSPSFSSNNSVVSLFTIQKMPIKEQIVALLQNANIMTFSTVLNLAVGWENELQIINLLQKHAVLIRGCWILDSSFCKDLKSNRSKAARNILLLSFYENEYVQRKEFTEKVGLHVDHAKQMLDQISMLEYEKGWRLKLPPDQNFIQKYRDVVDSQVKMWKARKEEYTDNLAKVLNERPSHKGEDSVESNESPSDTPEDQLKILLLEAFRKHGVCNYSFLRSFHYRKTSEKGHNNPLSKISEAKFKTCLESIATLVQNVYLLKKADRPPIEKYRNIIVKMYSSKLNYTKDVIIETCKKELKEDKPIPQSTFVKIMSEIAYEASPGLFILKDGTGSNTEPKTKT